MLILFLPLVGLPKLADVAAIKIVSAQCFAFSCIGMEKRKKHISKASGAFSVA